MSFRASGSSDGASGKWAVGSYWLSLKDSQAEAVARVQVMAWVPFSLETYLPLFPCRVIVPSGFVPQTNDSQAPTDVRLQVMGLTPFSDETYIPMLCRATLPPPASTTRNCSQAWAVVRVQVMAVVPSSPLTYKLLNPLRVIVCPMGAPLPPLDSLPAHLNVMAAPAATV